MGAERRRKPCKRSSGSASGLAVAFFLQKKSEKKKRYFSAKTATLGASSGSNRVKDAKLNEFCKQNSRVVLGTTTPTTRLFATGTTTLRRTGTTTWASALFAQPTSVGWLCKEIIKIFRFRGSAGPRSLLFNANAQNHIG